MIGSIKWFDIKKGWGFIKSNDREVFVHKSQVPMDMYAHMLKGNKVEFDLYEVGDKYEARNIKKA